MSPAHPTPPPLPAKFSTELRELAVKFAGHPVRLGALLDAIGDRGFHVLLVLASLPFLIPITLPGLSTPFGLVIAIIGANFAVGRRPWLPRRLLDREFPPEFLAKVLASSARIVSTLERVLRPRMVFVHDQFIFRRLDGILVTLSGMFLLLPLPIPFSNTLPAWTILLLAAGALERDGLFFIAGCVAFATTAAFFTMLAFGGMEAVQRLLHIFPG